MAQESPPCAQLFERHGTAEPLATLAEYIRRWTRKYAVRHRDDERATRLLSIADQVEVLADKLQASSELRRDMEDVMAQLHALSFYVPAELQSAVLMWLNTERRRSRMWPRTD